MEIEKPLPMHNIDSIATPNGHVEYSLDKARQLLTQKDFSEEIVLGDHIDGFDFNLENAILRHLDNSGQQLTVWIDQMLDGNLKSQYPNLQFKFNFKNAYRIMWSAFEKYNQHPTIDYKNFICSFNGSPHVSRKLLVSILEKFGYFNLDYCSKNFSYSLDVLDGHVQDYAGDRVNFYRNFFISGNKEDFFQLQNSFSHERFQHDKNIYNLESKLTGSFLHIVSESMATSYVPFVTEKFLYSVVTRGLFLAYAQPGWHAHVEKYYGFKRYTKLFDYSFDTIQNPVDRLVKLISMISKFDRLSFEEWNNLYLIEQDTIEYNYDHYFSGKYLEHLKQYAN